MYRIFFLLCLASLPLQALYYGNPAEPDIIEEGFLFCAENWASVKVGYQGDYCFDRKLKAKNGVQGRMDEFSYRMHQGVLTFNIFDLFEAYGSLGSMNAYTSHRPHLDNNQRNYDTSGHMTWGGGIRGELFHWGATTLSFDGKYQYSHLHVVWNTLNGQSYTTGSDLTYKEYQVGAGIAHQVEMFIPYFGLTFSSVDAKMKNIRPNILPTTHFSMRSRERFGLALGCGLSPSYLIDLNLEVRLFSEQAITFAGNLKF